jgi:uncharacterized membrane protein
LLSSGLVFSPYDVNDTSFNLALEFLLVLVLSALLVASVAVSLDPYNAVAVVSVVLSVLLVALVVVSVDLYKEVADAYVVDHQNQREDFYGQS